MCYVTALGPEQAMKGCLFQEETQIFNKSQIPYIQMELHQDRRD